MPTFKLISFDICPFVQRSAITLNEKDVPYEIEHIDLSNKPEWFLKLSPLGKVPVLVVDGEKVLFESAVINEYIDEITAAQPGGRRMLPADPLERAYGRAWIEFASTMLGDSYRMQIAKDADALKLGRDEVRAKLERLERELPADGPFFYGPELSLVDTAVAPALQRHVWTEELAPELALFDDLPKVTRWRDAMLSRESVKRSTVPDVRERFRAYLARNEAWIARDL